MPILRFLSAMLVLTLAIAGCVNETNPGPPAAAVNQDLIYQAMPLNALLQGVYDGTTTFAQLKEHGDIGLGTFNALDGEMLGFDGQFYQVHYDGTVTAATDAQKTPFAAVTFFEPDISLELAGVNGYKDLKAALDKALPTDNIFYVFKITGLFSYVKTRSVPAQTPPYRPLGEVVKEQSVFEFQDVRGTLVGFRCPAFVAGVNAVGYHLHFLTEDKTAGGHLLDLRLDKASAQIDITHDLTLILPQEQEFYQANLGEDMTAQTKAVEADHK